jgi:hypothetical protein
MREESRALLCRERLNLREAYRAAVLFNIIYEAES